MGTDISNEKRLKTQLNISIHKNFKFQNLKNIKLSHSASRRCLIYARQQPILDLE